MKIALIGAGNSVFAMQLIDNLLSFPDLHNVTLTLMDINRAAAAVRSAATGKVAHHHRFATRLEATDDLRRAVDGADYVLVTFQIGGLEANQPDLEIPRRYGIDQAVGDILGPGGVMRFLCQRPGVRRCSGSDREAGAYLPRRDARSPHWRS